MLRSFHRVVVCCVAALVAAVPAFGQQFTGGVRGAVSDMNGVIPGVTVTLVNEATNISREVVTNEVGQYNFPAVPPGTYTVKVQLSGFKTYESKGIIVGTQQFVTLDVTLEVGAIEKTVPAPGRRRWTTRRARRQAACLTKRLSTPCRRPAGTPS